MASYTYTAQVKVEIAGGQGSLESIPTSFSANGKILYDDVLPISADFSLEPFMATLDAPGHVFIKYADDSGFKIALNGVIADASSNKFKEFYVKCTGSGAPIIHLSTTVAARLQVIALGDPLPW